MYHLLSAVLLLLHKCAVNIDSHLVKLCKQSIFLKEIFPRRSTVKAMLYIFFLILDR